ncbi:MAG: DUF975 family protein [Clostridia bacterium]|nr:DUF975 family protein [Clostridia bacterium]
MAVCPKCGAALEDSAKFCVVCGAPLAPTAQAEPIQQQYYQPQQYSGNPNQFYGYANGADPNMGYPPPPPYGAPAPAPVDHPTVGEVYSKAFSLIKAKPMLLWGLSLLASLLCILSSTLAWLPIISIPLILVIYVGTVSVFLDAYRGKSVSSEQLFSGFKNFKHFCGGMAWMLLWIFIWGLIPVAGIVFAVIKAYSYRFVPYILLNNPDISAFDALKKSMKQTQGYRGKMFGADAFIIGGIVVACILLTLLSMIPYMGIIFSIIYFLFSIAVSIFCPLVLGLIQAAFYDEISKKNEQPSENSI